MTLYFQLVRKTAIKERGCGKGHDATSNASDSTVPLVPYHLRVASEALHAHPSDDFLEHNVVGFQRRE